MATESQQIPSNLSEEDRKYFEKYGRLPKPNLLGGKKQKKFDSADWAKNLKKPKAGSAKQPAEGQLEQHE
jgi:hypothetical protein